VSSANKPGVLSANKRGVSSATKLAAVIGSPVRHSVSPAIHNAAFGATGLDWVFLAAEVTPEGVEAAIAGVRAMGMWGGLSVTMPLKASVAGLLDDLSPEAKALGAVNTVVTRGGALVGHNTDGPGLLACLDEDAAWQPAGQRVVVLGAGGAARAVARAMAEAGARDVVIVARRPEAAADAAVVAGGAARAGTPADVPKADVIVNATPVGMAGAGSPDALPLDPTFLTASQLVVDLVYHPAETLLLAAARARGATTVGGLGMLVHQAALAFELWTDVAPPLDVMRQAAEAALRPQ